MRVAVVQCVHESNSFSPVATTLDDYILYDFVEGKLSPHEALGQNSEMAGFIDELRGRDVEVVPLLGGGARSGGNMTGGAVDGLRQRLLSYLRRAGAVDGVYLALHGSTVGDGHLDVTGEILADARAIFGPHIPIVCSLDFHANVTPAMAANCDAITAYRTFPHVDYAATGARAARLLLRALRPSVKLRNVLVRLPMILPAEVTATTDEPMAWLMARLDVLDKTPGIAGSSLLNVQPWLDVEELGNSIVAVADGDPATAERAARALAQDFWNLRHAFVADLVAPAEAVRRAFAATGPVVLSDSADATTSGATGDSTAILDEMVRQNVPGPCLVTVVDAEVAAQAHAAGVGAMLDVTIGGKYDTLRYKPLRLHVVVESLSDGFFIGKSPMGAGQRFFMGPTAVLRVGGVYIVAMTRPEANRDPELYRSQGLDPATARLVVVKSPTGYRAGYKGIAREMITVDGPGSTTARLTAIPFTRLSRPLYPLDEEGHVFGHG